MRERRDAYVFGLSWEKRGRKTNFFKGVEVIHGNLGTRFWTAK